MNLKLIAMAVAFAFAGAAQAQTTQTPAKRDADKPRTEQSAPRKAKDMAEQRIEAAAKADKAKCDGLKANAKDICMAEAKGKEKVAKAEQKLKETRAEAAYEVAKQKCDDQKGEAKAACMKQARVERDKAMGKAEKTADAKREGAAAGSTAPAKPKQQ